MHVYVIVHTHTHKQNWFICSLLIDSPTFLPLYLFLSVFISLFLSLSHTHTHTHTQGYTHYKNALTSWHTGDLALLDSFPVVVFLLERLQVELWKLCMHWCVCVCACVCTSSGIGSGVKWGCCRMCCCDERHSCMMPSLETWLPYHFLQLERLET